MPQPAILKVTEIFSSVQGEGLRTGEPTIFVRLTGCNLRCPFCDTKYAWAGGEDYTSEQILASIKNIRNKDPIDWVCLTGGEPLIQKIEDLVRSLRRDGFKVQIETNGTLFRPLRFDWISLSPKPPDYIFQPAYVSRAKEVKLVVFRDLTLNTLKKLRRAFPVRTPILLQPQSHRSWSVKLALKLLFHAKEAGLVSIKLSVQAHKILGIR